MDQKKVGIFLRELRKEKNLTQEELGEVFNVSNRTISRWENGFHLPDIDLLILLSDYYKVDLREMLDGERRQSHMKQEEEDVARKVADYTNDTKISFTKRVLILLILGFVTFNAYMVLSYKQIAQSPDLAAALLGFTYGMFIMGILYTSGCLAKLHALKMRLRK